MSDGIDYYPEQQTQSKINWEQYPILLFDPECSFCQHFADGIKKIDKECKINFVSIHHVEVYKRFQQLKKKECRDTVHLIDEGGSVHQGADVIAYLAQTLPQAKSWQWLLEKPSVKKVLSLCYDKINLIRKQALISSAEKDKER